MTDAKILQWNQRGLRSQTSSTLRNSLFNITSQIVIHHQPWFVIIQEMAPGIDAILRVAGYQTYVHTNGKLCTAWRSPWDQNTIAFLEHPHCLLLTLEAPMTTTKLAVWNMHLKSRSYAQDQAIEIQLLDIFFNHITERRREPSYQECMEIIAGDFNLQPYNQVFWTIAANRCLSWVLRKSKSASPKRLLYNPSWDLLNARTPTGGTYYYPGAHDSPWFVYDQALVSPQLGSSAPVETVTSIGNLSLCIGSDCSPNTRLASDHLPVLVPFRV